MLDIPIIPRIHPSQIIESVEAVFAFEVSVETSVEVEMVIVDASVITEDVDAIVLPEVSSGDVVAPVKFSF